MRAWRVHELGDPKDALRLEEVEEPKPGPGEVVVEVEAAALNFFDILLCQGKYQERPEPPFTPGAEVAGTVAGAGEGVALAPGTRVLATPPLPDGGFAEKVVAPAEGGVFPVPENMPYEKAAAMHIVYQTAYMGLHRRAGLAEGETVLVHAGAGGVGSAAIQVARAAGARVISTSGGPEKVRVCEDLGAELSLDYREDDFVDAVKEATGGRGADVIFDPVGGDVFDRSRRCVAFEGASSSSASPPAGSPRPRKPRPRQKLLRRRPPLGPLQQGHAGGSGREPRGSRRALRLRGIDPLIYDTVPFENLPDALGLLGSRKTYGKLVTRPKG
ncbi:NADPH:quinone oxidoreductase family protein [Rubrobacter marinus]|uniref:NADPH:quinone oxidoreductase family protein n=1 Tax=Rubrobacter marinus TaxID=2653852 RepID=UPI001A9EC19F|nr:NADPH:quinone oxidoreductase family protein [Rubrobacter marinus]